MRPFPLCLAFLLVFSAPGFALTPNIPAGVLNSDFTVSTQFGTREQIIPVAPRPIIPSYARHMRGRGIFIADINVLTGFVRDVRIFRSTGSDALNEASIKAFQQWQFRPRSVHKLTIPVEFTGGGKFKLGN